MSKNWFEQNINKKLSETVEDFDLDANWKAIQAKRSKKKRRGLFFWFVLPFVVIIFAGSSIFLASDRRHLKDQESISSAASPLASGNNEIEKNVNQSVTISTNEDIRNDKLNIQNGIPTLKKKVSKKLTNPVTQTTEIHQTSELSKASINQAPVAISIVENNSEIGVSGVETNLAELALESKSDLAILPLESRLSLLPESSIEFNIQKFEAEIQSKKPVKKTNSYLIGVSALYGLQSINRAGPENLYASRQKEEEALDMFQAGFEFGVKLNKRLSLQTGLNFSQFTDKRVYRNTEVYSIIDSNFLVSKILKADGSMQDIYGVAEIPYVREINETSYNRFRFMEVPVFLFFENKLRSNFCFRVGAGVSLGLISSRSGSISDYLNAQIPLSQASYKSQGQLAALIRIEWMYTKPGWSAGIILQGRSDLINQLKAEAGYNEKRTAYAFGLAYRIHL